VSLGGNLYAILDLAYVGGGSTSRMMEQLLEGGVDMVQLRGKNFTVDELSGLAEKLLPLTMAADVPLIVNDHAAIANRVEVQGVHVGQDDEAIAKVRESVGRPIIVGKSTHNLEQAVTAQREGADYVGFGPIYATPTKPDYAPIGLEGIGEVHQELTIPIFCIGGIKLENLGEVVRAGAQRVVIVSGLLKAGDPTGYARAAQAELKHGHSERKRGISLNVS
jgi:thiamine-phosphate pyrophosphorylase